VNNQHPPELEESLQGQIQELSGTMIRVFNELSREQWTTHLLPSTLPMVIGSVLLLLAAFGGVGLCIGENGTISSIRNPVGVAEDIARLATGALLLAFGCCVQILQLRGRQRIAKDLAIESLEKTASVIKAHRGKYFDKRPEGKS
jgi:hypothetical protein